MPAPVEHHITRNLDEHVALIKRQVARGLRDPEIRQLAVKIVSNHYEYRRVRHPRSGRVVEAPMIKAWGKWFLAPDMPQCAPKDERCEIDRLWEFVVLNVRYVYDPHEIDFFATAKETLLAGGGDCDDITILFDTLAKAIGFPAGARVISTMDDPDEWVHIYALIGHHSKDNPTAWMPLDPTVAGATPGWQYDDIARYVDYEM